MVEHVARVLAGQPLYTPPSLDWVPYLYAPFYYYVSALVAMVTGIGFFPLRLVSLASSLVVLILVYAFVRRESGNVFGAVVASGLFAGLFRVTGAWFDISRVDMLALALFVGGAFLIRFSDSRRAAIIAAGLLSLAFLTKQSMLLSIAPMAAVVIVLKRTQRVWFTATLVVMVVLTTWALESASQGWFSYYAFRMPLQHERLPVFGFWRDDVWRLLPTASALAYAYLLWLPVTRRIPQLGFYGALALGLLANSWASRMHVGGWDNVLIPGFTAVVLLAGLAVDPIVGWCRGNDRPTRRTLEAVLYVALLGQFAVLAYNPFHQVPTENDRKAGAILVDLVRRQEGEVLVAMHGFLSGPAGKGTHAHWGAIWDVLRGSDRELAARLRRDIQDALESRRFGSIILDRPHGFFEAKTLDEHYRLKGSIFPDDRDHWPVTGARTRPTVILVPKQRPPP
jgi:4-amino-4-deoxy-L-arabinose transferase-like glycosyltransferase